MSQVFHRLSGHTTIRESPLKYLIPGWGPGRGPVFRRPFPPRAPRFQPGLLATSDDAFTNPRLCPCCGEVMVVVSYNEFETAWYCPLCQAESESGLSAEPPRKAPMRYLLLAIYFGAGLGTLLVASAQTIPVVPSNFSVPPQYGYPFGFQPDAVPPAINSVKQGSTDVLVPTPVVMKQTTDMAFTVNVSDNLGTVSAALFIDGHQVGFAATYNSQLPATFNVHYVDRTMGSGPHDFRLIVYDAAGNHAERSWTMTKP